MQTKHCLGYLGLIPFILPLIFGANIEDTLGTSAIQVFIFYSAIIISFIAGTLWRKPNDTVNVNLQIFSNIFSLLAFFALLLPNNIALIVLAKIYLLILLCEYHFDHSDQKNQDYLKMRIRLTSLVVLLHIAGFLMWCV